MFNGFPSTQTPAVQWWDYSKSCTGTIKISLPNDCAPVQYFATGGSTTSIQLTLPLNPAQGKTITIKNDLFGANAQKIAISYGVMDQSLVNLTILGVGGSITLCYISQNTILNNNNYSSPWVSIAGGPVYTSTNTSTAFGYASDASGQYGTVGGGYSNTASIGSGNTVGGGFGNTASGTYSTVSGGQSGTASSTSSTVVGGEAGVANGTYSTVVGGSYGTTRGITGSVAIPASNRPFNFTSGASQLGLLALAIQTTTATPTVLTSNGSTASTTTQVILPNNSAYYFRGSIIAGVTGAGNTAAWSFEGAIKRGANAAATSIVQSVVNLVAQDSGASAWAVALTADTTNGGLAVTVTGQASTTIRWVCKAETTEMTY